MVVTILQKTNSSVFQRLVLSNKQSRRKRKKTKIHFMLVKPPTRDLEPECLAFLLNLLSQQITGHQNSCLLISVHCYYFWFEFLNDVERTRSYLTQQSMDTRLLHNVDRLSTSYSASCLNLSYIYQKMRSVGCTCATFSL